MSFTKSIACLGVFAFSLLSATASENLVKNDEFKFKRDRMPHWRSSSKNISSETENLVKGSTSAVKISIGEPMKYDGYVSQKIKLPQQDMDLQVSVFAKSTMINSGYVQIKLLKNKKELKRITAKGVKEDWNEIKKSFTTGEADEILVLCRYHQTTDHKGETIWFAKPVVSEITE